VIATGLGGSQTLFGGNATVGLQTLSAPAFTGSATVFGGIGCFQGGLAGGNTLLAGTVQGTTTLVGAGDGDQLYNWGAGNLLIAGAGAETLSSFLGTPTIGGSVPVPTGGETFITANGVGATALINASYYGQDTIKLGSGNSTVNLGHDFGGVIQDNTLDVINPGGTINVFAWLGQSQSKALGLADWDRLVLAPGESVSATSTTPALEAMLLSDGTTLFFTLFGGPLENFGSYWS